MGIFYNWKLVRSVPHLWNDIGGSAISDGTEEDDVQSSDSPDYADIML